MRHDEPEQFPAAMMQRLDARVGHVILLMPGRTPQVVHNVAAFVVIADDADGGFTSVSAVADDVDDADAASMFEDVAADIRAGDYQAP